MRNRPRSVPFLLLFSLFAARVVRAETPPDTAAGPQVAFGPADAGTSAAPQAASVEGASSGFGEHRFITSEERVSRLKGVFVSPMVPVRALFWAGLDQRAERPSEWGTGSEGFGKRTASAVGRIWMQGTVHEALAASVGLDPRYDRCRCSGIFKRTGHALSRTVVAYGEDGKLHFDPTQIGSLYLSSMASTIWYPESYDPFGKGLRDAHRWAGFYVSGNLIREFWPDVRGAFRGGKHRD